MKQLINRLSVVLIGSVAVAAGCSTSANNNPTDGGGLGGNGGTTAGVALLPDATGWVDKGATVPTMIQGAWYAYGDGIGSDGTNATGDCEKLGLHAVSECSVITKPSFGAFPNTAGKMCTAGTAAKVINLTTAAMPDYNNIWGAGIGLDLNNSGGDAGVKAPYNATANGVTGIAFDIDTLPLAGLRVEFPTPATTAAAAFWGGTLALSPVKMGHNEFHWRDVGGPFYLTTPPAFDPTAILSMQFHVPSGTAAPADYSFCVSNVTALTN